MPGVPSIFLINSDTFKKSFLSGDGQFELQSDQNIWAKLLANDGKFSPDVDRVADVGFSFNNDQKFKFGNKAGMKLSVGASAANQIHLIWPKQSDDDDDGDALPPPLRGSGWGGKPQAVGAPKAIKPKNACAAA